MKIQLWGAFALILLSSAAFSAIDPPPINVPSFTLPSLSDEAAVPEPDNELPQPLVVTDPNALPSFPDTPSIPNTPSTDIKVPALPSLDAKAPLEAAKESADVNPPSLPAPGDELSLPMIPGLPSSEPSTTKTEAKDPALNLVDSFFGEKEPENAKVDETAEKPTETVEVTPEIAPEAAQSVTSSEADTKKKRKSRKVASVQDKGFYYKSQILPDTIYMRDYPRGNKFLPKAQYEQEWDRLLFVTASKNDINGLRALLNTRRPVDLRDAMGQTPLIVAIRYKGMNTARLLLARGANPNAMDNAGNSAMHYAVAGNNYPMVRALIEMGGRYDLADSRGVTPVMMAEHGGNPLIRSAMGM